LSNDTTIHALFELEAKINSIISITKRWL